MRWISVGLVGAAVALGLSAPTPVEACGGLFCNNTSRVPVEQNGERVLFEVNDDGTITATVEIAYTGNPEDFAWVVPVPGAPTLDVAEPRLLAVLDDVTRPILNPPRVFCSTDSDGFRGTGGSGCSAPPPPFAAASPSSGGGEDRPVRMPDQPDVVVQTLPQVGPFEPTVVGSEDPDLLVGWLNDNDYLVTDAMRPFMDDYVAAGMQFLAMRLAPDARVSDIAPLRMTFPAERPMLPIVLSSVAAEPEMDIVVLIAGATSYQALNYANAQIDPQDLRMNPMTSQSNYPSLLGMEVDRLGGHAFVTQFASSAAAVSGSARTYLRNNDAALVAAAEQLGDFLARHQSVTRLATRLSPPEMTTDPVFESVPEVWVDSVLQVPGEFDLCADDAEEWNPCGDQYCGEGAYCAQSGEGHGCMCPEGSVAREVRRTNPVTGLPTAQVVCQDLAHDMMSDAPPLVDPPDDPLDVCAWMDCGAGTCVALNGFPTCDCGPDAAAVVPMEGDGRLTCVAPERVWTPDGALAWGPAIGEAGDAVEERPSDLRQGLPLAGFVLLVGGLLRRRSRWA